MASLCFYWRLHFRNFNNRRNGKPVLPILPAINLQGLNFRTMNYQQLRPSPFGPRTC